MSGKEKKQANILKVDKDDPDIELIRKAAHILRDGGLVAFPTETVYGLGANAFNSDAVQKIFKIKKRPLSDPIIVHISHMSQLEDIVVDVPKIAYKLADSFWPGPLTMIMRRGNKVPSIVSSGLPTVAVRMPSHPISIALINESGVPVAAPSANIFSKPSSTKAQHIIDDFSDSVDMIIDGGDSNIGVESTVVDLTQSPPLLLRPGGTPLEKLRELIPNIHFHAQYIKIDESCALTSPGQLTKHYSPNTKLMLFKGEVIEMRAKMKQTIKKLVDEGKKVGALVPIEDVDALKDLDVKIFSLGSETDLKVVARNLFSGMRELDILGLDIILVRSLDSDGLGLAILDRMIRASDGKIIEV